MKVDHVFGGHIYLISSFGDARNPLFKDEDDLLFFRSNIRKYLGEICDIFAYSHQVNQFQYLVKIKGRLLLEQFFYRKKASKKKGKADVSHAIYDPGAQVAPESYLIFSQEVSNCLNSYAKRFNFKHKRKGGLFGDRYSKILIEGEEEMDYWIEKLNRMEELVTFEDEWRVSETLEISDDGGECSSKVYYEGGEAEIFVGFLNFSKWITGHLRGCFDCLPPKNVNAPNFLAKYQFFFKTKGFPPPW